MCTTHQKISQNSKCNTDDHKKWNRRSFLQALGMVGGGTMMLANNPISVSKPSPLSNALQKSDNDNILVIVRLQGGNDGFNTIIPVYDYDVYANARPLLRVNPNDYISLNDNFAIPKTLEKLESLWGDGQMKVLHGVGYEDSSLSHFKGSDIYANTNFIDKEADRTGVFGRYFTEFYEDYFINPPTSPPSLQIGSVGNLLFRGDDINFSFSVSNPDRLSQIVNNGTFYSLDNLGDCTYGDNLRYAREVANTTFRYADIITETYNNTSDFGGYRDDKLGKQLSIISRLIKGGLGTKVYLVTLGGFDTHNNQIERHNELLDSFSAGLSNFYADLTAAGWDDKVLSMTISEFGRRFNENGSLGTDHGTAGPTMFFGTGLNGNDFVGEHPDLHTLTAGGNVYHTTDFRQVYATVMKEWLCIDKETVKNALYGEDFESLDLGFKCSVSDDDDNPPLISDFDHVATYENNQTFITISSQTTRHIEIMLYNVIGQNIATLSNQILLEGESLKINVKESAQTHLQSGVYTYRIKTNKKNYSKSIAIH